MKSIEDLIQSQAEQSDVLLFQLSELDNAQTQPEVVDNSQSQEVETYSNDTIIELIKQSVNIHWQQAIEMTGQGTHLKRWGYEKLADLFLSYGKEEHDHAAVAIERLEFFDTDYQPIIITPRVWNRHNILSILQFNLEGVKLAAQNEKQIITSSREVGDEITAKLFTRLLKGSDEGIAEFEKMLKMIDQIGIENFLTLQA